MAVENMLKLIIGWTGFGEQGQLTWIFSGSAGTHTPSELNAAAAAALHQAQTSTDPSTWSSFLSVFSTLQTVNTFKLYEYAVDNEPATGQGVATVAAAGTGQLARPLQVAAVATLRTANPGASFRGRQYYPGGCIGFDGTTALFPNAGVDALSDIASNLGIDLRDGLQQSLNVDQLAWSVYSPKRRVATPITTVTVDNKADTQRRREASLTPTHTSSSDVGPNPA